MKDIELEIDYVCHEGPAIDVIILEKLTRATLLSSRDASALAGKSVRLGVALVSSDEIERVNKLFREKDGPTDIISIGEYADNIDIVQEKAQEIDLGELILCWDFIQKSATILKEEAPYEFAYVFSHGVLHLLGYEHGEEMYGLQDVAAHAHADAIIMHNKN